MAASVSRGARAVKLQAWQVRRIRESIGDARGRGSASRQGWQRTWLVGTMGGATMRSHHLVRLGIIAAVFGAASPTAAAHFECPKKGGDLVFGGEAKVNSLDQYASNAISTRNVAMNMY